MNIFEGKDIMVTGGCGSIGSEIVRQLLEFNPLKIRVFDNSESGHFFLNQKTPSDKIRNLIGDIRDRNRVFRALEGVDIVFHAAALKHVPFCEYNPFEAVYTNVIGTKNLVEGAIDRGIERVVGISTDKAVNPVNTMGATKLLGEKIVVNAPIGAANIKLACVRFGNVLDSVGSVIPIFRHQIEQGGPITVTSDEMTRFFMTIPQAVKLVIKSSQLMSGREVYILKMPILRIIDLAEVLIEELAPRFGHDPAKIETVITGIRPGEKLHEHLFNDEELPLIKEEGDLFVLRNSPYVQRQDNDNGSLAEYEKDRFHLLNKEEVREMLKREKII